MKRAVTTLLVFASLSACAARIPRVDLNALSPVETEGYKAVRLLNAGQLAGRDVEVLGIVEGHSCRHMMWDPSPSRAAAVEQARYAAYKLGANAIANINYASLEGTSYSKNCWESVSVTAEAVKLATPAPDAGAPPRDSLPREMR